MGKTTTLARGRGDGNAAPDPKDGPGAAMGEEFTTAAPDGARRVTSAHPLIWRLHFYVGVFIAPLLVLSSVSGILYVFAPQIEDALYARRNNVPADASAPPLGYDEQIAAFRQAYPRAEVRAFRPSFAPGRTSAVTAVLEPPRPAEPRENTGRGGGEHAGHEHHRQHSGGGSGSNPSAGRPRQTGGHDGGHDGGGDSGGARAPQTTVYLDPVTGKVVGELPEASRFGTIIRDGHKTFFAGQNGRILTELSASWLMVLLLTGVYLWFPRKVGRVAGVWVPRLQALGRLRWRDLHSVLGAYCLAITVVLAFTGLTWSRFSGNYRRAFQKAIRQEAVAPALRGANRRGHRSAVPQRRHGSGRAGRCHPALPHHAAARRNRVVLRPDL
jgi:Uncharacterized iron-regulated membrane protein